MSLPFTWSEWQTFDALELASHIRTGQTTAVEVAAQAAEAIALVNPHLHAVLEVFSDAIDKPSLTGSQSYGNLHGVPMLMKDSGSAMHGRLREWGSRLSLGQRGVDDCPLTLNLRDAGINLLGRTTLPEAGKTFDTTFDYQGSVVVTRNPWNLARTPGGSSGGSAAIVASRAVPLGKAGDAAGSTRVPASFTGLIGHKPTRGLLPPPRGTNELTNHRIQEGVLTRTVRDQAAVLDAMIRRFPMSHFIAASLPDTGFESQIRTQPRKLKIGLSSGPWGLPGSCSTQISGKVDELGSVLSEVLGHHVEPVADDQICDWRPFWSSVETNWISTAWHWRSVAQQRGWTVDRVRSLLTPQNANLLDASERLTIADLRRALTANPQLMYSLSQFFDQYDVLLCPAFPELTPDANGAYSLLSDAPFDVWFSNLLNGMRYTVLGNESGIPSLCLPIGLICGMPLGALIYGRPLSDGLLLQVAAQLESARPEWFNKVPIISPANLAQPNS